MKPLEYAIINYYDLEHEEVWWIPAHLHYEHDYPALWMVVKLPRPEEGYGSSWPKWAAEESVIRLDEVEEVVGTFGYNRLFWRVWRNLEWLQMLVAAEQAFYVKRTAPLALLYKVKWNGFPAYYPVYITYTNKPFSVLIRRII